MYGRRASLSFATLCAGAALALLPACGSDSDAGDGGGGLFGPASCASDDPWSQLVAGDGPFSDSVPSLDVDDGCNIVIAAQVNVRLTESTSADRLRIAVLDAVGRERHSRDVGEEPRIPHVRFDPAGSIIVAAAFEGEVDFGGGPRQPVGTRDVFVAKLAADGSNLWTKQFGTASANEPGGLAVDSSGNIIVAGTFSESIDFGGGALTSLGDEDLFVVKLSADGDHLWSARYGSDEQDSDQENMLAAAVGPDDSIVIVGEILGTADFGGGELGGSAGYDGFVAKLGSDGSHQWSLAMPWATPRAVAFSTAGDVVVGGDGEAEVDGTTTTGSIFVLNLTQPLDFFIIVQTKPFYQTTSGNLTLIIQFH